MNILKCTLKTRSFIMSYTFKCVYISDHYRQNGSRFFFLSINMYMIVLWNNAASFLQTSDGGNVTISTLKFTPTIEDDNNHLTCRVKNAQIPASALEDSIRLDIQCKLIPALYFYLLMISIALLTTSLIIVYDLLHIIEPWFDYSKWIIHHCWYFICPIVVYDSPAWSGLIDSILIIVYLNWNGINSICEPCKAYFVLNWFSMHSPIEDQRNEKSAFWNNKNTNFNVVKKIFV